MAAIVRMVCAAAALFTAALLGGCGGYDVGPDPLPWRAVDEAPQSSAR